MADFSRMQSLIGKSWNSWNLPEGAQENDLKIMRALYKPKQSNISLEQKNPLPNKLMYLYGSRPEYDWFSLTQCPACKKFYKTQWLNNHYIKNAANEFLCRKTDIVVGVCHVAKRKKGPHFLATKLHHQTNKTHQNSIRRHEESRHGKHSVNRSKGKPSNDTYWSEKQKQTAFSSQHKEIQYTSTISKKSTKSKLTSSAKPQPTKNNKNFQSATYTLSIPNDDRDEHPKVDIVVVNSKSRKNDVKKSGAPFTEKPIKTIGENEGLKTVYDNTSVETKRKSSHPSVKVSKSKSKSHGTKHESSHGKGKSSETHKENYKFKIPLKSKSSISTPHVHSVEESKDLLRKEFAKIGNSDFVNDEIYTQKPKDAFVAAKVVYRSTHPANLYVAPEHTFASSKTTVLDSQSNAKSQITSKVPITPTKMPLVPKPQSKAPKSPNQTSDHHQHSTKYSSSKHQSHSPKQSSKISNQKSVSASTKSTPPLYETKNQSQHKMPIVAVPKTVSQSSSSKPKGSSAGLEKSIAVTSKTMTTKSPTAISSKDSQQQHSKTSSKSSKSSKSSSSSSAKSSSVKSSSEKSSDKSSSEKSSSERSSSEKSSAEKFSPEKSSSLTSKTSISKSSAGSLKSHLIAPKSVPTVVATDLLNASKWSLSTLSNVPLQPNKQQSMSIHSNDDYNAAKTKYVTQTLDTVHSSKAPTTPTIKSPDPHVAISSKDKKHSKSHSPSTSEISNSNSSKHSIAVSNLSSPDKKHQSKHVVTSTSETIATAVQQKVATAKDKKVSSKSNSNSSEAKLYHPVPIKYPTPQTSRDTSTATNTSISEDQKLPTTLAQHNSNTTVPPPYAPHKVALPKSSVPVKTSSHHSSPSAKPLATSHKPPSSDDSRIVKLQEIVPKAQSTLVSSTVETPIAKMEPSLMLPASLPIPVNQGPVVPGAVVQNVGDPKPAPKKKKKKKDKLDARRVIPLKDRCFNPDQHCGVVVSPNPNPCKRSLTCKTHSIILRRAVIGRSNGFDSLLAAHKKARDEERNAKLLIEQGNAAGPAGAIHTMPFRGPATANLNAAGVPIAFDPFTKRPIPLSQMKQDAKGRQPGVEVIDLAGDAENASKQKIITVIQETEKEPGNSYCDVLADNIDEIYVNAEDNHIVVRRCKNKWKTQQKRRASEVSKGKTSNKKRQRVGRSFVSHNNVLKKVGRSLKGNPLFSQHSVKNRLAARRNAALVHTLLARRNVDQKRNAIFKQTGMAKRALISKNIEKARKHLTVRNIMLAEDPLLIKQNKLAKGLCNLTLCKRLAMRLPFFARRPQFIEKYLVDRKYFLSKQYILLQQKWQLQERLKVRKRMLSCLRLAMKRLMVRKYKSVEKRKSSTNKELVTNKHFKINTYRSLRQIHVLKITKQTQKKQSEIRSRRVRRNLKFQLKRDKKTRGLIRNRATVDKVTLPTKAAKVSMAPQSSVKETKFVPGQKQSFNPSNTATKSSENKTGPSKPVIVQGHAMKSKPFVEPKRVQIVPEISLESNAYRQIFSRANSGKHSIVNYLTGKGFKLVANKEKEAQEKNVNESGNGGPSDSKKENINQTDPSKPKYVSALLSIQKLIEQKRAGTANEKLSERESSIVKRYLASQSSKDKNRVLGKCLLAKNPVERTSLANKVMESSKTLVFS